MTFILGHRGYSAQYLENSMQAFREALVAGMDGFELDVQPSIDGICFVLHDDDLARTARAPGILRGMHSTDLPLLNNGEPVPRLEEALRLPARLINVELKGHSGWQLALRVVERENALERVIFSSFEHRAILDLHDAQPAAHCGLLWETRKAVTLDKRGLDSLPANFTLHISLGAFKARPVFWSRYRDRLALWGMRYASEAASLPVRPPVLIADGP